MTDSFRRLGEILPDALSRWGTEGMAAEVRIRKAWPSAVGANVAAHARVHRLRGTRLEVRAETDSWATELRYLQAVVIERLNEVCGAGTVSEMSVFRARK